MSCSYPFMNFNSKIGYNYIDKANYNFQPVYKNAIPFLTYANEGFRLSIDTSNGSIYSDYNYNQYDRLGLNINLNRLNLDLNWRYYFRIYYENEPINTVRFSRNYSIIEKEEMKITTWLKLSNGTILNATCSIKTQYKTTTQKDLITTSNQNNLIMSTGSVSTEQMKPLSTYSSILESANSWPVNTIKSSLSQSYSEIYSTKKIPFGIELNDSKPLIINEIFSSLWRREAGPFWRGSGKGGGHPTPPAGSFVWRFFR